MRHTLHTRVGGERLALRLHGKLDLLALALLADRVLQRGHRDVRLRPLHGMVVGRANHARVVERAAAKRLRVVKLFGIGIAVAAVRLHAQADAELTADGITVDLLRQNADAEAVALDKHRLGGVAASASAVSNTLLRNSL